MEEYNEEYQEPQPERVSDGSPSPADYEDYDLFVKDLSKWQAEQTIRQLDREQLAKRPQTLIEAAVERGIATGLQQDRQAMAQAQAQLQAQAQRQLTPWPDDELRGKREEILERARYHHKERILAEGNKDWEAAQLHAYHGKAAEKELESLPKSEAQKQVEEAMEQYEENVIGQLYDPRRANDPIWNEERLVHDSAVKLVERNANARPGKDGWGTIRLPLQESAWGNSMSVCPKNMAKPVKVPGSVFQEFKTQVRATDPDEFFRQAHVFLRRHGYPADTPAFENSERAGEKSPDQMSMAEFTAWREEQEAERKGNR